MDFTESKSRSLPLQALEAETVFCEELHPRKTVLTSVGEETSRISRDNTAKKREK